MSVKLAISALLPKKQRYGGVASFVENLLLGVSQTISSGALGSDSKVTVYHFDDHAIPQRPGLELQPVDPGRGRFVRETQIAWKHGREADGFLFLNYFTPPRVHAERVVTTIHDLQHRYITEAWPWHKRLWLDHCMRATLRRCTTVATITEAVREDLLQHCGRRYEAKVRAIWNPVQWRESGSRAADIVGQRPYLLSVGVDRPQKNFATLIKAFAQLHDKYPDLALVIAGQLRSTRHDQRERTGQLSQELPSAEDLVERLGLRDRVVVTGFIKDEPLAALYRGAEAYVMPSLFEGFGMPAVEALGWRTPVVVSDLAPLREVTQGEATYVTDPLSADEMAAQIDAVVARGPEGRPTEEAAARFRRTFAPETIARQYLAVLTGDESLTTQTRAFANTS